MKYFISCLFLSCLLLFACQSDKPSATNTDVPTTSADQEMTAVQPAQFKVNIENLRVRDQAGTEGKELLRLPTGHEVVALGEISDFTNAFRLRGVAYEEPWIKIKTNSGQEGWVYTGGLQLNRESELGKQLLDRRLDNFAGTGTAPKANQYLLDYQNIKDVANFVRLYREGGALADSLNFAISDRIELDNVTADEPYPDVSWLEESLPGFVPEVVAEGTQYYLFRDFRQWYPLAEKTPGSEDNEFLDLMVQVHSMDSVAYFFPSWFLQTWDYGGNSLLGKGIHLSVLESIERLSDKTKLFEIETTAVKESLLSDIIGHDDMAYEMSQKDIIKELDQILSADLSVLTKEDVLAIQQRRKIFEKAKENNILVNQRAGM